MNIPHLPILLTCAVTVVCPLQADYTAAGQEVSAAIDAFSTSLREINALLQGVQDRSTADAAIDHKSMAASTLFTEQHVTMLSCQVRSPTIMKLLH